jgi:hypothetical protein
LSLPKEFWGPKLHITYLEYEVSMFRRVCLILSCLLLVATAAQATDVYFHNVSPQGLTVTITYPNGSTNSHPLSAGTDGSTYTYWDLSPGIKSVQATISDESGTQLWSGTANAKVALLVLPEGEGIKVVPCGFSSGNTIQSGIMMNATGEPLTVDLEGSNGIAAIRNLTPPAAFDPKSAIKMDAREAGYYVKVKGASGPIELYSGGKIDPGRYYVLRKDTRGNYRCETFGYLKK